MKIYTKTGDRGETGFLDGQRISKADPRVAAYGEVDELSALLGLTRAEKNLDPDLMQLVITIQRDLFSVGARLADPTAKVTIRLPKVAIENKSVELLEEWIDRFEAELPPLRQFILAGGVRAGATLHLARAVCRRAERHIVSLGADRVDPVVLAYINRLSDLLFVMARIVNHRSGVREIEW